MLMPSADSAYAALATEALQDYAPAFAAKGLSLSPRAWDRDVGTGAGTLALFAWGYHADAARWTALLDKWPADRPLFNPPALMRWNMRKTYLCDLEAAGVPIVPSWFGDADAGSITAAFARFGTDQIIVKPQISAGSHQTYRLKADSPSVALPTAILQPYLQAIVAEGEISLLFIDGRYSHAVRKRASGDDFRCQPQFGGIASSIEPDPEWRVIAERAMAALPQSPLYARVDLIRRLDGTPGLMELEVIEPDLFPEHGKDVPLRLATAVASRINNPG